MGEDRIPLSNDDELAERTAQTNFNITRIFKYFLLVMSMAVILLLVVVFAGAIFTSRNFRDAVNDQLKDNIIGIVITALAVIGINLDTLRSRR